MTVIWFIVAIVALIVVLAVILIVQQYRRRDYGSPESHRDNPSEAVEAAKARASAAGSTRRSQGSGPF